MYVSHDNGAWLRQRNTTWSGVQYFEANSIFCCPLSAGHGITGHKKSGIKVDGIIMGQTDLKQPTLKLPGIIMGLLDLSYWA